MQRRSTSIPLALLLPVTACLHGCSSKIHQLYADARDEALADPPAMGADWEPDATLGISWDLANTLLEGAVDGALGRGKALKVAMPLGLQASLTPDLDVASIKLSPSNACGSCAALTGSLDGDVAWKAGPSAGRFPLVVELTGVVELSTTPGDQTTSVEARVKEITARLPSSPNTGRLGLDLDDPLVGWVSGLVRREVPPIPIAEVGTADTPVRTIRLSTDRHGLMVETLSTAPASSGESLSAPRGYTGWYLAVDSASVLALGRRAAFEHGELAHNVHADPRQLSLEGERFSMLLRLWRLAGAGWWRDYHVTGTLSVEGGKARLSPEEVQEVDHSRGAALVDPIALLARGAILSAMEDALTMARPARQRREVAGQDYVMRVDSVEGSGATMLMRGSMAPPGGRPSSGGSRRGRRERSP